MFKKDGRADCSSSLDSMVPALEAKLAVSSQMLLLGVRFPVGVLSCQQLFIQFEPRLNGEQFNTDPVVFIRVDAKGDVGGDSGGVGHHGLSI